MAAPIAKLTVNSVEFNKAVRDLAKISGIDFEKVMNLEVGKVMEGAIRRTRVAKVAEIQKYYQENQWATFDGKKYKMTWRMPDAVWYGIEGLRQQRLAGRIAARGLAKKSFWHIARRLPAGIGIVAPGYVVKASAAGVPDQNNVSVMASKRGSNYTIEVVNRSPVATTFGAKGFAALRGSMRGRQRFFEKNLATGAFRNADRRMKKYKGLFVKPGTP